MSVLVGAYRVRKWMIVEEIEIRADKKRMKAEGEDHSSTFTHIHTHTHTYISLYHILISFTPFPSSTPQKTSYGSFLLRKRGIGDWVSAVKPNPRESCAASSSSSLERKKRLDDGRRDKRSQSRASGFLSLANRYSVLSIVDARIYLDLRYGLRVTHRHVGLCIPALHL